MHVGINALFLIPSRVGGTETYLRQTLGALARGSADVEFTVFTNRENDDVLRRDAAALPNVAFFPMRFHAANRVSRIVREQTRLVRAVRRRLLDVLWSPGYTSPMAHTCPQVVTIPDLQYKRHPEDLPWIGRVVTDLLVQKACRSRCPILTLSEFSKREILQFTQARAEDIHVTPLGVDPAFGQPPPPGALARTLDGRGGGTFPYLLTVANTYPHKRVHLAVEAFSRLAPSIPHHLVIVGIAGLGERRVRDSLRQCPARDRVHRFERVSRPELVALYHGADAFVFPSVYEGFGLPVAEALAAGTPVVATREAAIPEVGGEAACYVAEPSADALAAEVRRVLGWDAATRRSRVEAGRAWSARFDWERAAERTLRVLSLAAQR